MAHIDKEKLLEALRASIQNPKAGELLIHRIESGEFEASAKDSATEKTKGKPGAGE